MASGRGTDTGRGCLLFGDKRAGIIQILVFEFGNSFGNLRIWFSGITGMFKTHVGNAIKKAKRLKGVIRNVMEGHIPKSRSSDKTVGDFGYP